MPRPGKQSDSTGEKTSSSASSKRAIRWFVHPPSFSLYHKGPAAKRSNPQSSDLAPEPAQPRKEVNVQRDEVVLTPTSTTTGTPPMEQQKRDNAPFKSPSPIPKRSNIPIEEDEIPGLDDMVQQLQQALDQAEIQMKQLQSFQEVNSPREVVTKESPSLSVESSSITSLRNHTSTVDPGISPANVNMGRVARINTSPSPSASSSCCGESQHTEAMNLLSPTFTVASKGAAWSLAEETNHQITLDPSSIPKRTPAVVNDNRNETGKEEDEKDSLDPDHSARPMTPSSMQGPFLWQALAFENFGGMDDENTFSNELEPVVPPMEVTAIHDPKNSPFKECMSPGNLPKILKARLRDADERANAYRQKLESSQDLVASLFRDLERARRAIQSLVTRNMTLSRNLRSLRMEMDDNSIRRSSLIKACVYITPIFVLWGGLEYFVSTILLIWIMVELESGWNLVSEMEEEEDDISNEEAALLQLQKKEFTQPLAQETPIPKNIVLSK